jgi:RimJ/RimL family protein N-acetyltransferase
MRYRIGLPNRVLARPLETERFELRPLNMLQTFQVTNCWRNDPEILSGIFVKAGMSPLNWLRWGPFPDNIARFSFAIIPKSTSSAIGLHMVKLYEPRSARNVVGIHDRAWWGKGVVLEVRARLMNHFFRHGGVERFCGEAGARNTASIFNYRSLGYDHVGTQHSEKLDPMTGEPVDLMLFEIFRDRWMAGPFAEGARAELVLQPNGSK